MKTAVSVAVDTVTDFIPVLIREIELGQPLPTLVAFDPQREQIYRRVRCVIRLHTWPLGTVDLPFERDELAPGDYAPYIWQALGEQINAHLHEDGLPAVAGLDEVGLPAAQKPECITERDALMKTTPFASVVISTHERPAQLACCLEALLAMRYPHYEVIVVDNAPSTSATAELIQQKYADEPKIRYVREDRPGSSSGRNHGILEASGEIIAFIDDDVVVDTYWLAGLAKGFSVTENVACVTSLLLPLELETPAQFLFEAAGGFTGGFEQRIFDLREHRWKKLSYPYFAGALSAGVGASMAFTTTFLHKVGGLDPALSPGTPTFSGEDPAILLQVILQGHRLVYEPASLAYHQHRRDYAALQRQLYGYGVGFTAYLTKIIVDHPWLIFDCFYKFLRSLFFLWRHRLSRPEAECEMIPFLQELKRLHHRGMLRGPFAYIRSRWSCGWTRKGLALIKEGK